MRKHGISFDPSTRITEQHHKDKCDIHRIVKSASRTGIVDHLAGQSHFSDVTAIPDFKTAMDIVARAKSTFAALPAKQRLFFNNDPSQYVAYCSDPANLDKLAAMGMATPRPQPISESEPKA